MIYYCRSLHVEVEKIHKMNTKSYKSNDVDKLDYCCRFCCVQKKYSMYFNLILLQERKTLLSIIGSREKESLTGISKSFR